jgi:ABC-type transport system involved in multi-copper enzyme maturation permease subunit
MSTFCVAFDLLRESLSRRWFLALGLAITLVLLLLGLALRLEVVDGALAATRLFGTSLDTDVRSVDVALRPVFQAAAYAIFYGGLGFGVLACADFGPSLLAPGRIEHLLALPLRRPELLAGTFLGVLLLATAGALYGAGGLSLILGVKTGVWTLRPVAAALLASVTFSAIYGAMLATAVFARSSALSAAVGASLYGAGIVAGYRENLLTVFEAGVAREAFAFVTLLLPRVSAIANAAADIAASQAIDGAVLGSLLAGLAVFGLAMLALAVWRFEGRDF